jgi:hypothetical protein
MGLLYPPTSPVLTGDVLTVNRFLTSPTAVQRRLRTLADQRFLADVILTGRIQASGGAISYEQSETIYSDRVPTPVAPGGEYERALAVGGIAALAKVTKYGQDIRITDEAIGRQPATTIQRVLTKLVNRAVKYIDTISLAAIAAAVTQTQSATAAWNAGTADPFLDVMLAEAQVADLAEGYSMDTIVLTSTLYARLVANQKVIGGLARESTNTVTNTGQVTVLAGLVVRPVPASRMPAGISAMVLDSAQLGSLGYEDIPSPEYTGNPASDIQTWTRRDASATDSWLVRGRRPVVPIVQEPNAAVKLTGV